MKYFTLPIDHIENFKNLCVSNVIDNDYIMSLYGNIEMVNKNMNVFNNIIKEHRPNIYKLILN